MTTELDDLTWQSLYEYIERRITGTQNALQLIQQNTHGDDLARSSARFKRELEWLGWCLPLVSEMLNKEDLQAIRPIMSLDLIRLRCRHLHDGQDHSSDFAWITPIAEGKYFLKRIRVNDPVGLETLWSFEGDLRQVVEKLENLVKKYVSKTIINAAQHSVHLTGGYVPRFQSVLLAQISSVKMALSRPARQQVTQPVGWLTCKIHWRKHYGNRFSKQA